MEELFDTQPDRISARRLARETHSSAPFINNLAWAGKIQRHPTSTDKRIFYTLDAIQIINDIKSLRTQRPETRVTTKMILKEMQLKLDRTNEEVIRLKSEVEALKELNLPGWSD